MNPVSRSTHMQKYHLALRICSNPDCRRTFVGPSKVKEVYCTAQCSDAAKRKEVA